MRLVNVLSMFINYLEENMDNEIANTRMAGVRNMMVGPIIFQQH